MLKHQFSVLMNFLLIPLTKWEINNEHKISSVLGSILRDDQKYRSKNFDYKSYKFMKMTDKINLIKINSIIKRYNWPYSDKISNEDSRIIFLVIQHSKLSVQKKYFQRIKDAVSLGILKPSNLGMFEDRIAIQEGRPQIYGTQVGQDLETRIFSVLPIDNPETVNERRKSIGLAPLSEYLKFWNIEF